jgi:hypothetical protein
MLPPPELRSAPLWQALQAWKVGGAAQLSSGGALERSSPTESL